MESPIEIIIEDYPQLKFLCWSYHRHTIDPVDALHLYERYWQNVDRNNLTQKEKDLIAWLTQTVGKGCFLG